MSIIKREDIPESLHEYEEIIFLVNILSHKWSLGILLALKRNGGTMRFNELKRYLNISHSVLSKNLKYLIGLFLIRRRILSEMNPPSVEYSLTEEGLRLAQICCEMKEFGVKLVGKSDEIYGENPPTDLPF